MEVRVVSSKASKGHSERRPGAAGNAIGKQVRIRL